MLLKRLYGLKISEKIEIEHVFQSKAFFHLSSNLHTSCLSAFKLCRSATSLKTNLWSRCFLVNFGKFVRTPFLQNTTGRLLLLTAVSVVVKGELANKTVYYDTKTKVYVPV